MSAATADKKEAGAFGLNLDDIFFRVLILGLLATCSVSYHPISIGSSRLHDSFIYWDAFFVLALAVSGLLGFLAFGPVPIKTRAGWIGIPLAALTAWFGFSGLLWANSIDFLTASITQYIAALLLVLFVPGVLVRFRLTGFTLDAFLACSLVVSLFALAQGMANPGDIFINITSILTPNRSHIGIYMLVVLTVGLFRIGEGRSNWRAIASLLAFICILISGSRAALLASLPIITLYFSQKISFVNLVKLLLSMFAVFLILSYIVDSRKGVVDKETNTQQSQFEISKDVKIDASAGRRLLIWAVTWKAIQKSSDVFWRGFGFTNYRWEYGRSIKLFFFANAAHNVYLHVWFETGLIGLILFIGMFAALILLSVQLQKIYAPARLLAGLAIGLLMTGFTQETFFPNEGGANLPVFIILACVTIAVHVGVGASNVTTNALQKKT